MNMEKDWNKNIKDTAMEVEMDNLGQELQIINQKLNEEFLKPTS
jgi:hypothetical protein